SRSMRLMHLHDIALLAVQLAPSDWEALCAPRAGAASWWALPPLRLAARYYPGTVPEAVLARLARQCPLPLRLSARRQTMTRVSCSALWLQPMAGLEWACSAGEVVRYLHARIRPSREAVQEREDMLRTQLWLQG